MASVRLYNPNTHAFEVYDPTLKNGQFAEDILLLNILLELKAISELLDARNNGVLTEPLDKMMLSLVSNS